MTPSCQSLSGTATTPRKNSRATARSCSVRSVTATRKMAQTVSDGAAISSRMLNAAGNRPVQPGPYSTIRRAPVPVNGSPASRK